MKKEIRKLIGMVESVRLRLGFALLADNPQAAGFWLTRAEEAYAEVAARVRRLTKEFPHD